MGSEQVYYWVLPDIAMLFRPTVQVSFIIIILAKIPIRATLGVTHLADKE
jgi:hypothetical protein